ncbi:hypothetical protein [Herbidospora cretacea]|nr:hypothetical protein [Herbidospora cretacea]
MLRSLLFTMIGLDVGLRFSRHAVRRLRRILPVAMGRASSRWPSWPRC